jgi:hypothetical protein
MAEEKKPSKKPAPAPASGGPGIEFEMVILAIVLFFVMAPLLSLFVFRTVDIFGNPYIHRFILVYKILAALVSLAATAGTVYVGLEHNKLRPAPKPDTVPEPHAGSVIVPQPATFANRYQAEWNDLKRRLETASDNDAALLVIEADAILDRTLKDMKIPGDTMGDRMKALSGPALKSSEDMWQAHKVRNEIAHEGAKNILYMDALYAIEQYERVLKELGVI